jgi:5-methylcytosine-specific restriction endonuclease McrA
VAKYPKEFLDRLRAITAKRAKTVIDHILANGFITTEELKNDYGYNHPPRAIRDVKEQGIDVEMYRTTGADGRSMAAYRFADPTAPATAHSGRRAIPKAFKKLLIERDGGKCGICLAIFDTRSLQIDHRVPFAVAADKPGDLDPNAYFLVCGSCNRAKSWSCEHCQNWLVAKKKRTCQTCYWANLTSYTHIALEQVRRLDLVWQGDETADYDRLASLAESAGTGLPDFVKEALRRRAANGD